ncbi:MAG: 1-acyl-sn-glycerol-3-phosphate acyltransferase [Anaerolineae bacterium]|nr:1-acyl-sn-glycerol-3-phosphate acyltransferase [Anaerolineae bacterium]
MFEPERLAVRPKRYILGRIIVAIVRVIAHIIFKLRIEGAEKLPRAGPVVMIGNHVNFADPALGVIINRRYVKGMTAVETYSRFLFNFMAWSVDAIPVVRGTPDRGAIRACIEALQAGWALYIAPEGTRSNDGKLQRGLAGITLILLKAGTHIPVYPIGYVGLEHFWSYAKKLRRTPVQIIVGDPFTLNPPEGRVKQHVREAITTEMMAQIAALLPEENHGVYAGEVGKTPQYLRFDDGQPSTREDK